MHEYTVKLDSPKIHVAALESEVSWVHVSNSISADPQPRTLHRRLHLPPHVLMQCFVLSSPCFAMAS